MLTPMLSSRLTLALAAALVSACSSLPPSSAPIPTDSPSAEARDCVAWMTRLDETVAQADVADAQEARVAGQPHLRTNRFTAALAQDARVDDASFARDGLTAMRALDRAARSAEISNLPALALLALQTSRTEALQRSETCATLLMATAKPARNTFAVASNYSTGKRFFGAYALTRYPFTAGVERQFSAVRMAFARPLEVPAGGKLLRYVPLELPMDTVDDALLLNQHQPVFETEVTLPDDEIGALAWDTAQRRPVVQTSQPAVYTAITYTRYRGQTLRQLVYTVWFGARPADGPGDLLAGHLDGLIWRVTLDRDNKVLLYDTIHPCGCYHYFITTPSAQAMAAPPNEPEWAFVPQTVAAPQTSERVVLRIATRTHYLERVTLEPRVAQASATVQQVPTVVLPQDALRALPQLTAGKPDPTLATHSAFGPDALVPETQRGERFIFWPMGIVSPGQPRQWGHHATAFVGERHFDDAHLLERRFELLTAPMLAR